MPLLEIKDLHASVPGREILKGVDLTMNQGEVHAIMGKNGSGKSTLAQVLMGKETYEVTQGSIAYKGQDLLELSTEERAREGMFIAFQYPVEIPGVSTSYFLRAAVNEIRKHQGKPELSAAELLKMVREKMTALKMDASFMQRGAYEGSSGGEERGNEGFRMVVCDAQVGVRDETDSGRDIDALVIVGEGADKLRGDESSVMVITLYLRLLDVLKPDDVHVIMGGRI